VSMQQTTTCQVQWTDGRYHTGCVQGWAVSVLFHGLIIALAVTLLSDLKLVPQAEPFKWDVAMVQSERPAPPTKESTPPAPPIPEEPRPVEKRVVQTQQVVQRAQPVQEVVQQRIREVRPIVEAVPLTSETVAIPKADPMVREPITAVEPAPADSVTSVETPLSEPVAQREVISEQSIAREAPVLQQEARVQQLQVQSRPAARADYGWLAEALWRRVERLKRYPHLARLNRWEGKVVLQAVVREDGQVLDVKVSQSSGYAVLDQDGMEVLRRASPLSLKHPLGQAQVVIQVPISYRLEH
jgi:protein TonB